MQEHIAFRYLAAGASIIPLQRRDKRPFTSILPNDSWATYQQRRASAQEVAGWIQHGAENWGLICGLVSGRAYCGDVDIMDMSHWVLDDPHRPVFRGACIVRSGSGKAHVWFRSKTKVLSGVWYLTNRAQNHAGDIRGDGRGNAGPSYMVVPPSLHPDTGEAYRVVAGDFENLPDVSDGDAFLRAIGDAYLADVPTAGGKYVQSNDRDILVLSDVEKTDVLGGIRSLGLKKKIVDTLLVPGNQFPGSRHWPDKPSHSEIDQAVVLELARKGLDFPAVERIFACAELGAETYRNKSRPNHGYGYLKYGFDKARAQVEREKTAARTASGANFKVEHVTVTELGPKQSVYHLELSIPDPLDPNAEAAIKFVDVNDTDIFDERIFSKAVGLQLRWLPQFTNAQRGHNFADFTSSIMKMVEDIVIAPREVTEAGYLASVLWRMLKPMRSQNMPTTPGEVSSLGWRVGDEYYFRLLDISTRLRGQVHPLKGESLLHAMQMLGSMSMAWHTYADGEREQFTRLVITQKRGPVQALPALPPPSA